MQYKVIPAFFIFLGSYFPLAIILAIQDIPRDWWTRSFCNFAFFSSNCDFIPFENSLMVITFILITATSVLIANYTLNKIRAPHTVEIINSKAIPNDIINYVFPYVVSFMGISYSEPEKLLGFSVFILWMFAITYKSGQIIMNPLLLMFGWRLYEASIIINNNNRDVRLLKKGTANLGFFNAQVIQDFYIIKD